MSPFLNTSGTSRQLFKKGSPWRIEGLSYTTKKRSGIFCMKTPRPPRNITNHTLRSSLIQTILSVPESTVHTVSPVRPPKRFADYTAGGESHPALKNHFLNYRYYSSFTSHFQAQFYLPVSSKCFINANSSSPKIDSSTS